VRIGVVKRGCLARKLAAQDVQNAAPIFRKAMPAEYCLLLKLSECRRSRIFLLAPSDAIPCTLLTNLPQESCPLYPRKRTCAVQEAMSAMGQKQTCAAHGSCPPRAQRRKSFQGLLGRQIGHWRSRYRVFDHRGGRRGVRRDPDIIGRQAKSYSAAALCFSPAIASLIAVCTSQWRDRTTASMRSRNSRRLSGGSSLASVITA